MERGNRNFLLPLPPQSLLPRFGEPQPPERLLRPLRSLRMTVSGERSLHAFRMTIGAACLSAGREDDILPYEAIVQLKT